MNYKNIYIEKAPEELVMILDKIDELSYEAKTALYDYLIENPSVVKVDDEKLNELKLSYQKEDDDISNLKHLSNLGLKIKGSLSAFSVKRSGSAIFVDITGIVIGILLMLPLNTAFEGWKVIWEEGVGIMSTVGASINTIIGIFGFILFTKALNRFVEFMSFRINKEGEKITITRIQDLKKRTYLVSSADILVEKEENTTSLAFVHSNVKHELLRSNEGRVLQNTIQCLGNKLKE